MTRNCRKLDIYESQFFASPSNFDESLISEKMKYFDYKFIIKMKIGNEIQNCQAILLKHYPILRNLKTNVDLHLA